MAKYLFQREVSLSSLIVDSNWNSFIMKKYQQLLTLEEMSMTKIKKLGDFIVSIYDKPLNAYPYRYYLSSSITNETRIEISSFMNKLLVDITNETSLTWNILDAIDIHIVTGHKSEFPCIFF